MAYDTITINYFDSPAIKITYPALLSHDTMINIIIISGTTNNTHLNDTVIIYTNTAINTTVYIPVINGVFSGTAAISALYDSVAVYLFDTYGRIAFDTININFFDTPAIEITHPTIDIYDTANQIIIIYGTTKNTKANDTIAVYCNSVLNTTVIITAINGSFSGTVKLNGFSDSVAVHLNDNFGRTYWDTIMINYFDSPTIKITYPAILSGYDTFTKTIMISGTTNNTHSGDTVVIYRNTVENTIVILTLLNGTFSGTVTLSGLGDSIIACLTDSYGRLAYDTITINYYDTPGVKITAPAAVVYDTLTQLLTIQGTAMNSQSGNTVIIYVNSSMNTFVFTTSVNGVFSGTAFVSNMLDSVWVELTDTFGRKAYDTITINYYDPPLIKITYPTLTIIDTATAIVNIKGTTNFSQAGNTVAIYANSTLCTVTVISGMNGTFSGTAALTGFYDSICVALQDTFGRIAYDTITINYFGPPSIKILLPDVLTYDTTVKIVQISGTTNNTHLNDTIVIYTNTTINTMVYVPVINGAFSGTAAVNLLYDSVAAYIFDTYGRIGFDTINVNFFDTPLVYITSPSNAVYYETNNLNIELQGTAYSVSINDSIIISLFSYSFANGIKCDSLIVIETSLFQGGYSANWNNIIPDSLLLDQYNTVAITIKDKFGRYATDTICIHYFTPPIVYITYPISSYNSIDTMISNMFVKGTVSGVRSGDTINISIFYNNSDTQTSETYIFETGNTDSGVWIGTALISRIADSIIVKITTAFKDTTAASIKINYIETPVLNILLPSDTALYDTPYFTNNNFVNFSGIVKNISFADSIILILDGETIVYQSKTDTLTSSDSYWSITAMNLRDKYNTASISAFDQFGRTVSETYIIYVLPQPQISICYPLKIYDIGNYDTSASFVSLSGTAKYLQNGDSVGIYYKNMILIDSVTVSNFEISSGTSIWSGTTPINIFSDSLYVYGNDIFGRTASDSIILNHFDTPSIEITVPNTAPFIISTINGITVSGTYTMLDHYDSIIIYGDTTNSGILNKISDTKILIANSDTWMFTNILLFEEYNTFVVSAKNIFYDTVYDTIIIRFLPDPLIEIVFPPDNYDTKSTNLTILGTTKYTTAGDSIILYSDSGYGLIKIYDTVLISNNGSWSIPVFIDTININITAEIITYDSKTTNDSVMINQFDTPVIYITNFGDTIDTTVKLINVSVLTNNIDIGDTIIFINNFTGIIHTLIISDTLSKQSVWNGTVTASGLGDTFTVIFINQWGDTSFDTLVINYYDTPSIKITYPANAFYDTMFRFTAVSGTTVRAQSGSTVSIFVNQILNSDYSLIGLNDNFTGTAIISALGDSITARLIDRFGRITYDTITMNYYQPPSFEITYPDTFMHDTRTTTITIKGTTQGTITGETIIIFLQDRNGITVQDTIILGIDTADTMNFTGYINVSQMANTVTAQLEYSRFRYFFYDTIYINYFDIPAIDITYPDTLSHDTAYQIIYISGNTDKTRNGDTVNIYVNNVQQCTTYITGYNGVWQGTAKILNLGDTVLVKIKNSLSDTPGYDTITANYYGVLSINILSPLNQSETNIKIINIMGTVNNSKIGDSVNIYINSISTGVNILQSSNPVWFDTTFNKLYFSGTAALTNLGDSIIVRIQDKFGRIEFDTRIVHYFDTPIIKIIAPPNNIIRTTNDLIVDCTSYFTHSGDTVKFYIDGVLQDSFILTLTNDNNIQGRVSLTGSGNILKAEIIDRFGRISFDTIVVNYFKMPEIKITEPQLGSDTSQSIILLKGTTLSTQTGDSIIIYSNSVIAGTAVIANINGNWQAIIELDTNYKIDTITAVVRDYWSRLGYDTIYINYFSQPKIIITNPVNNYDTHNKIVLLSGTAEECSAGDSVFLFVNNIFQDTFKINSATNRYGLWSCSVSLTGANDSVAVRLLDKFSRTAQDTITINYYDTPRIYITNPLKSIGDTITKHLVISGTIFKTIKGGIIKLYINGILNSDTTFDYSISPVDSSVWTCTAVLVDFANTITAVYTDWLGYSTSDSFNLNFYDAPKIKIVTPADNTDTTKFIFLVSGTTMNTNAGDTIKILCNASGDSHTYTLSQINGDWARYLEIKGIQNTVAVIISDNRWGRVGYDTIVVNYFDSPSIEITSPLNNSDTITENIIVCGTSLNSDTGLADTVIIFVNGILNSVNRISEFNSVWSGTAKLTNICDSVSVMFTDQFGRRSYDTISINYFTPANVKITFPALFSHDTMTNVIQISGTSFNSRTGDSILIFTNNFQNSFSIINSDNADFSGTAALTGIADSVIARLTDRFGRMVYDTITVNYYDLPKIKILNPLDKHDTLAQSIFISGTTLNTQAGSFVKIFNCTNLICSAPINSINGIFSGTVSLYGIGDSINVELIDIYNRKSFDTITVNYYPAPEIKILYPAENVFDTNVSIITVSGTTKNTQSGNKVEIHINSALNSNNLIFTGSGAFSSTASLNAFNDSVIAIVSDIFGRKAYDTITARYFGNPAIKITYPANGVYDTYSKIILISGTTQNSNSGCSVIIYVNEQYNSKFSLNSYNSIFSGTAALSNFGDSVKAELIDLYNRKISDTIIINYFGAIDVKITSPANMSDTITQSVIIKGTTKNSPENSVINIYVNNVLQSFDITHTVNGNFSGTAQLNSVGDSVKVEILDGFNRRRVDTIVLNYYKVPLVEITNPVSDSVTLPPEVIISAKVQNTVSGDTILLYFNGVITDSSILNGIETQWISRKINFTDEINTVVIKLLHSRSPSLSEDTVIIYLQKPEIFISYPMNSDTNADKIKICGFTNNSLAGDTIKIYVNSDSDFQCQFNLQMPNAQWDTIVSLTKTNGENKITAELINIFKYRDTDSIMIRKIEKPSIQLNQNSLLDTNATALIISGTVSNNISGNTVLIYDVNGNLVYSQYLNPDSLNLTTQLDIDTKLKSNTEIVQLKYEYVIVNQFGDSEIKTITINKIPDSWSVTPEVSTSDKIIVAEYDTVTNNPVVIPVGKNVRPFRFVFPVYNPLMGSFSDSYEFCFNLTDKYSDTGYTMVIKPAFKITGFDTKNISNVDNFGFIALSYSICDFQLLDKNNIEIGSNRLAYNTDINCTYYFNITRIPVILSNNIRMFTSPDEKNDSLIMVSKYSLNENENYIAAQFEHLSIKAVFPISGGIEYIPQTISDVVVYPNPFIPYDNNNSTGKRFDGSPGSGVYFKGIKEKTRVKVYDIRGKLVYENTTPPGQGYYQWPACNSKGNELASGVYIILFQTENENKTVKFVIIR